MSRLIPRLCKSENVCVCLSFLSLRWSTGFHFMFPDLQLHRLTSCVQWLAEAFLLAGSFSLPLPSSRPGHTSCVSSASASPHFFGVRVNRLCLVCCHVTSCQRSHWGSLLILSQCCRDDRRCFKNKDFWSRVTGSTGQAAGARLSCSTFGSFRSHVHTLRALHGTEQEEVEEVLRICGYF